MKNLLRLFALLACFGMSQQAFAGRTLYFYDEDALDYYSDNMSFTCVVEENGERIMDCEVAAFDENGGYRGSVASRVSDGILFLMVAGTEMGDKIHFKLVTGDGTTASPYVVRDLNETYYYVTNDVIGSKSNPYVFTVGETAVSPAVTLNGGSFATYSSNVDVKIATEGVKAYKAAIGEGQITLTELNGYIPAGTGVLLHKANSTEAVEFEAPAASDAAASNLVGNVLRPTTTATKALVDISTIGGTIWALSATNSFKKYSGTFFSVNRAFLVYEMPSNTAEMRIVFGDEEGNETALQSIETATNAKIYDLNGRQSTAKGLVIMNDKVVFTK